MSDKPTIEELRKAWPISHQCERLPLQEGSDYMRQPITTSWKTCPHCALRAALDIADALAVELANLYTAIKPMNESRDALATQFDVCMAARTDLARENAELAQKLDGMRHAITDTNVVIEQVSAENAALRAKMELMDAILALTKEIS